MTLENGSINSAPKISDTDVVVSRDAADNGGDNLGQFRLPVNGAKSADIPEQNTGEGLIAATATGAAVGMTNNIVGTAIMKGAENVLGRHIEKAVNLESPGMFTDFGGRLARYINNGSNPAKNPFALLGDETRANLGLRAQLGLKNADEAIIDGLKSTVSSGWAPEPSMLKLARNGAIAGVSDWAVDRGLESLTGSESLRPNWLESSLVTGAVMSPLQGRYKVGAVALAVGIGKLSNIVGLT